MSQTRKKLSDVVKLGDITVYCKLAGSRLRPIITGMIYKPSEVVQIPDLFTMRGFLGKKMLKDVVGELKLEEW